MGYLYRPRLKSGKHGRIWWAKYYVDGRAIRESTGTDDKDTAKRLLKAREGAAATGAPVMPRVDRIGYDEIAADLRQHYQTTGCRDLTEADKRLKHLARFFTGRRVATITGAEGAAYTAQRQAAGVANGTINRELAVLGRMLRLAYENGKLPRLPVIRKLKEAAPRQGFFEREAYDAVRRRLPSDLQVAVSVEYAFGWRCQSEAGCPGRPGPRPRAPERSNHPVSIPTLHRSMGGAAAAGLSEGLDHRVSRGWAARDAAP